ncbi:hypothetical protein DFP72DRAFT_879342 [Ephemerocybe angulata]|uniref:Uncharacterized protein n=1 Tax=Ephemerocybe angulata TaxID=980116 RepID=A0A8H6IBZ1_9AGAR|nr:hypothetical protein DFP72DRAFT_879342 [Tulosesus angulatus]
MLDWTIDHSWIQLLEQEKHANALSDPYIRFLTDDMFDVPLLKKIEGRAENERKEELERTRNPSLPRLSFDRARTVEEKRRHAQFLACPLVDLVHPGLAICRICWDLVCLSKKMWFDPAHWKCHLKRCTENLEHLKQNHTVEELTAAVMSGKPVPRRRRTGGRARRFQPSTRALRSKVQPTNDEVTSLASSLIPSPIIDDAPGAAGERGRTPQSEVGAASTDTGSLGSPPLTPSSPVFNLQRRTGGRGLKPHPYTRRSWDTQSASSNTTSSTSPPQPFQSVAVDKEMVEAAMILCVIDRRWRRKSIS